MSQVDFYTELAKATIAADDPKIRKHINSLGISCPLIGVAKIKTDGGLWEPDPEGVQHLIYPVLDGPHICDVEMLDCHANDNPTPLDLFRNPVPIVDLIAWRTTKPEIYLRAGNVWALGQWECRWTCEDEKDPLIIYDTPLSWIKATLPGALIIDWQSAMVELAQWPKIVSNKLSILDDFEREFKKYKRRNTPEKPLMMTTDRKK